MTIYFKPFMYPGGYGLLLRFDEPRHASRLCIITPEQRGSDVPLLHMFEARVAEDSGTHAAHRMDCE